MLCKNCRYYSFERVKKNRRYFDTKRDGRCGKFDAYSIDRSPESGCSMGIEKPQNVDLTTK